eukprot:359586-Chlamydomonas_euryale.AAC.1
MLRVWQHCHDGGYASGLRHITRAACHFHTAGQASLSRAPDHGANSRRTLVVHQHVEAGAREVEGHGAAHGAQPNKANCGSGTQGATLCTGVVR